MGGGELELADQRWSGGEDVDDRRRRLRDPRAGDHQVDAPQQRRAPLVAEGGHAVGEIGQGRRVAVVQGHVMAPAHRQPCRRPAAHRPAQDEHLHREDPALGHDEEVGIEGPHPDRHEQPGDDPEADVHGVLRPPEHLEVVVQRDSDPEDPLAEDPEREDLEHDRHRHRHVQPTEQDDQELGLGEQGERGEGAPIAWDPESPMMIWAGAAFHHRNPARAPITAAAKTPRSRAPSTAYTAGLRNCQTQSAHRRRTPGHPNRLRARRARR